MEKYEFVKDLDAGSFCVTKLMRNKQTKELVAMKFIERGPQMYSNVAREIKNHVCFPHPEIVCFKEVTITKTHLVLMMEYANGELSKNVDNSGGLSKDEIFYEMEKYEVVKDLGAGSFGVTKLMRNKQTEELFAVKFIERGPAIDENVEREIINHRLLQHPNIVRFKKVFLTPTHLAMVMEYAAGGELFEQIYNSGCFVEDKARYFFQQLISGLDYIHSMQICHRDLKLDNILLDGSIAPRLKICDFGYSKSARLYSKPNTSVGFATYTTPVDLTNGQSDGKLYPLHSTPNTNVGSPTYAAPEVLAEVRYDGKMADVWSCGVTLYIMLFGAYPFEDLNDPKNFSKTFKRIMAINYKIPENIPISQDCRHLLSCIFVRNPKRRISIEEIKRHPWFLAKLPWELTKRVQLIFLMRENQTFSRQSMEEIIKIVGEARKQLPQSLTTIIGYRSKTEEDDEEEVEEEGEEDDEAELEEEEEDEDEEEEEDKEDEDKEEEADEEEDEEEGESRKQLPPSLTTIMDYRSKTEEYDEKEVEEVEEEDEEEELEEEEEDEEDEDDEEEDEEEGEDEEDEEEEETRQRRGS